MIGLPLNSLVDELDYAGGLQNPCAQAAVATCVAYYRTGPFAAFQGTELVTKIHTEYPPDVNILRWNLGTWPQYIAGTMIPGVGLSGVEYSNNSGGNAENGITPQQWLTGALERQHPVICLLDATKIWSSQPWYTLHYVVVYAADSPTEGSVHFTNGLGSSSADWATFLDAWHVWFLSNTDGQQGMQYAAIEVSR